MQAKGLNPEGHPIGGLHTRSAHFRDVRAHDFLAVLRALQQGGHQLGHGGIALGEVFPDGMVVVAGCAHPGCHVSTCGIHPGDGFDAGHVFRLAGRRRAQQLVPAQSLCWRITGGATTACSSAGRVDRFEHFNGEVRVPA